MILFVCGEISSFCLFVRLVFYVGVFVSVGGVFVFFVGVFLWDF